ncbi:universal stress protein [Arsenicicoccus bolidensis]|uniref:Universal stress protein n=1 Tax=Arsenicicoccus bolidensis TaxID=229480 RepID=A0ABS9Q5V7_9MICO|nr:universal stress protein [Arsenicicoccus bolidensis]MCG7323261.1 universal stress protein [Arsenicicoccus bolidensis]
MTERPYTVAVGVSATSGSAAALAWARDQAETHGGELVAIRAWKVPSPQATPSGISSGRVSVAEDVEHEAMRSLEADVEAALGPDHGARLILVRGGKRKALLDAAEDADLLVVDAPRGLPATGTAFAQRLVYAAACPVVVMPPRVSGERPGVLSRAAGAIGRGALRAAATAGRPGYRTPPPG